VGIRGISRNVLLLGVVSLLTDISSEMLYPLIPLFLTRTLGASVAAAAMIEGCAELTASLMKGVTGSWSSCAGRRKPFVVLGYAVSAVAKSMLAFAASVYTVLAARVAD
jgi:hypothetical protein